MAVRTTRGLVCLLFWWGIAQAQNTPWNRYIDDGNKSLERADFAGAEASYQAALKEAEKMGPENAQVAASLNNLSKVPRCRDDAFRFFCGEFKRLIGSEENFLEFV